MVDEFQDGRGAPLLLISLKAGGTGLNLAAAAGSSTTTAGGSRRRGPGDRPRAPHRADRPRRAVKLVTEGTLEERIADVIDDKRALADAVVGTSEAWLTELSTDGASAIS